MLEILQKNSPYTTAMFDIWALIAKEGCTVVLAKSSLWKVLQAIHPDYDVLRFNGCTVFIGEISQLLHHGRKNFQENSYHSLI